MDDFEPIPKRPSFWRFVIVWGLFLFLLILFRKDWLPAWHGWRDLLFILLSGAPAQSVGSSALESIDWYAMLRIPVNILIFCGVYLISLFVVAQFVLPVHTWQERIMAWNRLRSYLVGWHGPAVFVREGKLISRAEEDDNVYPGVALVDLRSAIVLEQTNAWALESETDGEIDDPVSKRRPPFSFRRGPASQDDQYGLTRVCGPGINFTEWGEKIRNVVDLRPQIRLESGVKAFTKDGIEVETRVFVGFSLSSPPDVIPVAYVGGNSVEDLYGLVVEEKSPGMIAINGKFSLDSEDAREIHRLVVSGSTEARTSAKTTTRSGRSARKGPFAFDEHRIFSAAYGQAYRGSPNEKTQWHELPLLVAVEIFRNHLEQYTYDYLYMLEASKRLPWLNEIKPEFMRKVKHQGLLSFKLMRFAGSGLGAAGSPTGWDMTPLDEKHFGQSIPAASLESSPAYEFRNTHLKPLRERGIAILFAGFAELKPQHAIRVKMAERWKAKLDLEIRTTLARNEREAMQLINNARTQVQRDATYSLSNLLKRETHSKEALALLLFQALQAAATDEKNKDLPPREILGMMQNLHRWLLVEWEESDAKRKAGRDARPPLPPGDQPRNT
jgi:hypothetical protein